MEGGVMEAAEKRVEEFKSLFERMRSEIAKVIVGQEEIVDGVLTAVLANGHCLLEGVPGLGKTLLVRTLAECVDLDFSRIQFTPDLMPADIRGTNLVVEDAEGRKGFQFSPGPIFANVILADEINRATPKTQSALLDAMQERIVAVGDTVHRLDEPFFVLATQNPIEMEGTYPLPEAQMDRFLFKLLVKYPSLDELSEIVNRTTGVAMPQVGKVASGAELIAMRDVARETPVASHVQEYAMRVTLATHPDSEQAPDAVKRYVRYGSSPRGAQALMLAGKIRAILEGRYNVAYEDIRAVAQPSLRHRVLLNFEGQAEGIDPDALVSDVIEQLAPTIAAPA
jgi:MoxR-like ATPase